MHNMLQEVQPTNQVNSMWCGQVFLMSLHQHARTACVARIPPDDEARRKGFTRQSQSAHYHRSTHLIPMNTSNDQPHP